MINNSEDTMFLENFNENEISEVNITERYSTQALCYHF